MTFAAAVVGDVDDTAADAAVVGDEVEDDVAAVVGDEVEDDVAAAVVVLLLSDVLFNISPFLMVLRNDWLPFNANTCCARMSDTDLVKIKVRR